MSLTRMSLTSYTRKLSTFAKNFLFLVKVEGESALPDLYPEKRYFATNLIKPKIGDYIVFKHPKNDEIFVKKVSWLTDKEYYVKGNVSWATSSKDFGKISKKSILGRVFI